MQAILLAAGFGTRLRPYSTLRPKPLFPVLNQPLLHLLLARLTSSGFTNITVNAHHLAGQIETTLASWPQARLQFEPEILGTGGSLRRALPFLRKQPVLVANGDVYHDIPLQALYTHHLQSGNDVTLAMHDLPRFNTVHTMGDRVLAFGTTPGDNHSNANTNSQCLAFTGLQVVNPELIAHIPAQGFFHIIDLYQQLAPSGRIGLMRVDGCFWQDIGTPADYLLLHKALLPQQQRWLIEPSAQIGKDVQLRGWGCIGAGAVVARGAELYDCVVWDGAQVPAGAKYQFRILTGNKDLDREQNQNKTSKELP